MTRAAAFSIVILVTLFACAVEATSLPSVCTSIDCRCLENATFTADLAVRRKAVYFVHEPAVFTAVADYRGCGINYNLFVRYDWDLYNGNASVSLTGITTDAPELTLPARLLVPQMSYRLVLTATGYRNETETAEFNVEVVVPPPVVRLNGVSRTMRTGPENIVIPASVTVVYGNATTAAWACTTAAGACPQVLLTALEGATNTGVTIAGPVPVGNYTITFTYEEITRSLALEVVATAVPQVTVEAVTTPIAEPLKFLYIAKTILSFSAEVESTAAITGYVWTLNGEVQTTTTRVIDVNVSHLVAGSTNTLNVRATTASDYGETSLEFELSAVPALALDSLENVDQTPVDTAARALTDRIRATVTSPTMDIFGVALSYSVRFADTKNGKTTYKYIMSPVVAGTTITFEAPMPSTGSEDVSVTFYVDLVLNTEKRTYVLATASSTFTVEIGNRADLATAKFAQIDLISNVGDLLAAAAAADGLMSDETVRNAHATTLVNALILHVVVVLSEEASNGLAGSLENMVTESTAANVVAIVLLLTLNGDTALVVMNVINAALESGATTSSTVNATEKIGAALLNSGALGEAKQVESSKLVITVMRLVLAAAGRAKVAAKHSSIELPEGGFAGLLAGALGGLITVEFVENPFPAEDGTTITSQIVSFSVNVGGSTLAVSGLTSAITIEIASQDPASDLCRYYNTAEQRWDSEGLTKTGYTSSTIICSTTHLTSFGLTEGSASSAFAVAVSAAAVLFAVIAQLVM